MSGALFVLSKGAGTVAGPGVEAGAGGDVGGGEGVLAAGGEGDVVEFDGLDFLTGKFYPFLL